VDQMPANKWPLNVDQAVDRLNQVLEPEQSEAVRRTKEVDLIQFHEKMGRGIRNQFGLWRGNTNLFDSCGVSHPDDASMVIIEALWNRLSGVQEVPDERLNSK
jgi:hypothetical protein